MELHATRPTVKRPPTLFRGDVYGTPIYNGSEPSRMSMNLVRFAPGARSNWHRHAVGQTLHVTEGVGLVGIRSGEVIRIRPGDTVVCPPDEEHWHGATPTRLMVHLALNEVDDDHVAAHWGDHVSDEEYTAAGR